ncbi:MAG: hypothetical protein AB8E15_10240 [Bdellovibrionales bacterium]
MPKAFKWAMCLGFLVIFGGLSFLLFKDGIQPKFKGLLKLSGFVSWQEYGKYSYRQLYPVLLHRKIVLLDSPDKEFLKLFITGFNQEVERQGKKPFSVNRFQENNGSSIWTKPPTKELRKGEFIKISFDSLLKPAEVDSSPLQCIKENRFQRPCIKLTISRLAKKKWNKIPKNLLGTLNETGQDQYLGLRHSR